MSDQNFLSLKFLTQKTPPIPQILKHHSTISGKEKIPVVDKGKNIQEAKEEGLRVDMAIAMYKAATVTLDEDLAS